MSDARIVKHATPFLLENIEAIDQTFCNLQLCRMVFNSFCCLRLLLREWLSLRHFHDTFFRHYPHLIDLSKTLKTSQDLGELDTESSFQYLRTIKQKPWTYPLEKSRFLAEIQIFF